MPRHLAAPKCRTNQIVSQSWTHQTSFCHGSILSSSLDGLKSLDISQHQSGETSHTPPTWNCYFCGLRCKSQRDRWIEHRGSDGNKLYQYFARYVS
ncbi:hypothetical protein I7I53_05482 [Histoplasma capsulatum var. duboisii H88]|uniref:Uncharacterized protein n=1 Tax=Ajellomyces capsulatus (strain H88) TaxID=544711 RepID=A0A8A1LYT0_AJEC8|nr:hypothetical protein I7I53_05482 [Histoplasma capsulatum var. duboisii H88]